MNVNLKIYDTLTFDTNLPLNLAQIVGYQRQSQAEGDYGASFKYIDSGAHLVTLFNRWCGAYFAEHLAGDSRKTTFVGQIYTLRLYLNGRIYLNTLSDVINDVVISYRTQSGGTELTATASNTVSQTRYGLQATIQRQNAFLPTATATILATNIVQQLDTPDGRLIGFYPALQGNFLEVTIRGGFRLLERELFNATTKATVNISTLITNVVNASSIVSTGSIATNSQQAEQQTNGYTMTQQRLSDLLTASGANWRLGAFGKLKIDYYQLDKNNPRYRLSFNDQKRQFWQHDNNRPIPDALVKPGQYVTVPPLPGLPSVMLLDQLTFDGFHIQFTSGIEDRLAAIQAQLSSK